MPHGVAHIAIHYHVHARDAHCVLVEGSNTPHHLLVMCEVILALRPNCVARIDVTALLCIMACSRAVNALLSDVKGRVSLETLVSGRRS